MKINTNVSTPSAGKFIKFVPEDFKGIYSVEEIENALIPIIERIRRSSAENYKSLRDQIKELISLIDKRSQRLTANNSLERLFSVYKKLQQISLGIRNSLSAFGLEIEQYDTIDYAIYYDGMRYKLDHLDISMLRKTSRGALQLNLNKATKELRENIQDEKQQIFEQLFRAHYAAFQQVIQKTYKGGIIGQRQSKGQRLNLGHIAEAFEAHTSKHDKDFYQIFKNRKSLTDLEKMGLTQIKEEMLKDGWWDHHETVDEAWKHIRGALGTQRGTVAGDVLQTQVKSGTTASPQVKLASLHQLNEGIRTYSMLLNEEIAPSDVAKIIALWITEPITTEGAKIAAAQSNEKINKLFDDNTIFRHL